MTEVMQDVSGFLLEADAGSQWELKAISLALASTLKVIGTKKDVQHNRSLNLCIHRASDFASRDVVSVIPSLPLLVWVSAAEGRGPHKYPRIETAERSANHRQRGSSCLTHVRNDDQPRCSLTSPVRVAAAHISRDSRRSLLTARRVTSNQ